MLDCALSASISPLMKILVEPPNEAMLIPVGSSDMKFAPLAIYSSCSRKPIPSSGAAFRTATNVIKNAVAQVNLDVDHARALR